MASDAELESIYGAGASAPPPPPPSDASASGPDLSSVYPLPAGAAAAQPPPPAPDPDKPPPGILSRAWHTIVGLSEEATKPATEAPLGSFMRNMATGTAQGVNDVVSAPVRWLAPDSAAAKNLAADRDDFTKNFADQSGSGVGRALGQTIATAPLLSGAGGLAGAGLRATGLPGIAAALDFLGGGAKLASDAPLAARLATRGGSLAAQGGLTGAGAGALTAPPDQSIGDAALSGAEAGAIGGPIAGSVLGLGAPVARALTGRLPNMVGQDVAPLAKKFMDQYGIELDPTQLTTNPTYKIAADQLGKLPFSGAGQRIDQARTQWQAAVAREMGEDADNGITHAVMNRAATRIGPGMDDIANRTVIQGGQPLHDDLVNIAQEIPAYGLTDSQKTPIKAQFQNVLKAFNDGNGQIGGKAYQNLTQTGGPLDTVINSDDPSVAAFGMKIKGALDDAFQRSAAPGDQDALQQLRYQYRVMKTIQPLVEQKGLTGDIDPGRLLSRVRAQSTKFDPANGGIAYTGGGNLGELAYGGTQFFGKQPDSGTAARMNALALLGTIGGAVLHPGAAAGTAATLAGNNVLQRLIRSPGVGRAMVENTLNAVAPTTVAGPMRTLIPAGTNLLGLTDERQPRALAPP